MQNLPIHQVIPDVIETLESNNRLVLQAPPGAGKTTALPIALLDEGWLEGRLIIMLEPRRLAARNAAARMAELLGEKVGERVGYQIRADRCVSDRTKILVVTEGILTRMLQGDPALESAALVIFDEFHERNLHGDLALALTLQSQELLRDDLKIMVMSATLDSQAIADLLGNAPVITSQGRSFPVENIYLDSKTPHPSPKQLSVLIGKLVTNVLQSDAGSVLIFLPGVKEIKTVESRLLGIITDKTVTVAPLYGDMGREAQDAAIRPPRKGHRKVVLATNIAETSLTIEGITVVIDAGLQRLATFNSGSGMDRLDTVTISQDAATQRSGRAGRLSPGKCYRLWHEHRQLPRHTAPEILTNDLTPMMLELANWGVEQVDELQWLDLPKEASVRHARQLLQELGALQGSAITQHGKKMLALGVHPRLAHMMLRSAELGLGKTAAQVAALLTEKDIFSGHDRYASDLSLRVAALEGKYTGAEIDSGALHRARVTASGFIRKLRHSDQVAETGGDSIGLLLAFAYPDRIAQCRGRNDNRYLLSGGKGGQLQHDDTLFGAPYLVVAELDGAGRDARIFTAASIAKETITAHLSALVTQQRSTRWNDDQDRVEARERSCLGAIVLEEQAAAEIDDRDVANALLEAIRAKGLSLLNWSDKSQNLRKRVRFLRHWSRREQPVNALIHTLPDLSDEGLEATVNEWLLPHLAGIKNLKSLRRLDTDTILSGMLTWEMLQQIDMLAPARLKVPSGSSIALNYDDPEVPVLAVRLQELFGMVETPKLLNSTVTLTIELLSPAHRPMQVTKDLKSFWDNTYTEVKKELRGKYKKHYWPDDPYQAVATSKTKKHM